jgi:hypothetical protein
MTYGSALGIDTPGLIYKTASFGGWKIIKTTRDDIEIVSLAQYAYEINIKREEMGLKKYDANEIGDILERNGYRMSEGFFDDYPFENSLKLRHHLEMLENDKYLIIRWGEDFYLVTMHRMTEELEFGCHKLIPVK